MALETERCSPSNASSPGPMPNRRPGAEASSNSDPKPRSAFHQIALLTRQDATTIAASRLQDAESPGREKSSKSPDDRPMPTESSSNLQRPFSRESCSPTSSLDQPRRNGFLQEPRQQPYHPDISSSFSLVYGLIPRLPMTLHLPNVYHPDGFSRLPSALPKFSEQPSALFRSQSPDRLSYKIQTQHVRNNRYTTSENSACSSVSLGQNSGNCNCCRSPTPPTTPPRPDNHDEQQQHPGPSTSLNFSVDNILRPEFGKSALITSKPRTPKRQVSSEGTNHHHHHHHHNHQQQKKINPAAESETSKKLAAAAAERQQLSSESSENLSKDNEPPWPAWVYCTHYSDRPSSDDDSVENIDGRRLAAVPTTSIANECIQHCLETHPDDQVGLSEEMPSTSSVSNSNLSTFKDLDKTSGTVMDLFADDSDHDPTYVPSTSESDEEMPLQQRVLVCHKRPISIQYDTSVKISPQKSRKKRNERKLLRNTGKEYKTASGKTIKSKTMKPLANCRAGCKEKLTEEYRKLIFDEYWNMGDYNKRAAFLGSLVSIEDKSSCRPRTDNPDKSKFRLVTYKYFFECNGQRVCVCKGCFLKTLDESENVLKVVCLKKRSSVSGVITPDNRGVTTPSNKWPEEKLAEVRAHINRFPNYESHYSRSHTQKRYLQSHLTLTKMYLLYKEVTPAPVDIKIYTKQFKQMNIAFKKPKIDTCHKCDVYKMKLQLVEDEVSQQKIVVERDAHHDAADRAYNEKKVDKLLSKENGEVKCLTFDLQQCLPTPALQSSVAFYKRSLWTFNLTINDASTGESTHYMWHEAIAGRGAKQIASCLFMHIKNLPITVKHVVLYSDTCGGQNRNSPVSAMFTTLLSDSNSAITTIDHKFMVPGHSHMEVDVDHSIIERKKKKTSIQIFHPHDWYQLVRTSSKKFKVVEMQQSDFKDFALLLRGPLVLKKKNTDGENFKWHDVQWFRYTADFGNVLYKESLSREQPFKTLSLKRRGNETVAVKTITNKPVAISAEKKKDLLSLLSLVPTHFHNFYQQLQVLNKPDDDPDLVEFDADETL